MRRFERLCVFSAAVAFASAASLHGAAAAPARCTAPIGIGYTLTHDKISTDTGLCIAKRGATLSGENNIVLHYGDPDVRAHVQDAMRQMASEGARVIRTNVWYRYGARQIRPERNRLGMITVSGAGLPQNVLANLARFVSDAGHAGYKRFIAVSGAQGKASPKCRRVQWGDCFDQSLLQQDWAVTRSLVIAGKSAEKSGIVFIVDLAPEDCRHLENFVRYMVQAYVSQFHDSHFIASCAMGLGGLRQPLAWLSQEAGMFEDMNVRPDELDVHVYRTDPQGQREILLAAQAAASRLGVPFSVNETAIDNTSLFRTVADMTAQGALPSLRDVLVWPKHSGSACAMDVNAPYDLSTMKSILGGACRIP